MSRGISTFIALVSGVSAGIAIGVLYAPDKGKNTRDRLTYQLAKYRDQLQQYIEDLVEGREPHLNHAQSEGQRVVNDARERAEKLLGDVEELIGQIRTRK